MSVPPITTEANDERRPPGWPAKLKILVAVHLAVGALPILMAWVPADVRFLPLFWGLNSIGISQLMLLSFWGSMGTSSLKVRLIGTVAGIAYVAIWPPLAMLFSPYAGEPSIGARIADYLGFLAFYGFLVFMFTGVFLVMRRWQFRLRRPDEFDAPRQSGFQYSVLNVLVITSLVAIVLTLMQRARTDDGSQWRFFAAQALVLIGFLINLICAVRSALGRNAATIPVFLSLLTAALLGIALALGRGHDQLGWLVFAGSVLVLILPTAIVTASLLVVRSRGYRLLPLRTATC